MMTSHAADSAAGSYFVGYHELAAIKALAEHLHASPAEVDHFLQHAEGVPPKVLLSWICLWDLRRRNN